MNNKREYYIAKINHTKIFLYSNGTVTLDKDPIIILHEYFSGDLVLYPEIDSYEVEERVDDEYLDSYTKVISALYFHSTGQLFFSKNGSKITKRFPVKYTPMLSRFEMQEVTIEQFERAIGLKRFFKEQNEQKYRQFLKQEFIDYKDFIEKQAKEEKERKEYEMYLQREKEKRENKVYKRLFPNEKKNN